MEPFSGCFLKRKRVKKKVSRLLGLALFLLILILLAYYQLPDNRLHLVFCDIGQGDAILVSYRTSQILIDGGPPKSKGKLLVCLKEQMPFWDRKIEVLVNTHPEEDHFGGLTEVVRRYRIGWFINNGFDNPSSWKFEEFKKELIEQKVCSKTGFDNESFRVKDIYFDILWPEAIDNQPSEILPKEFFDQKKKCPQPDFSKTANNLNNYSLALHLRFGQFDALLTGDLPKEVEQVLVWRKKMPQVEVLKLAHHGSKTSSSEEILQRAKPQLAVISVGENQFGHPSQEVLERLKVNNISWLTTQEEGTIEIVTDGEKWFLK